MNTLEVLKRRGALSLAFIALVLTVGGTGVLRGQSRKAKSPDTKGLTPQAAKELHTVSAAYRVGDSAGALAVLAKIAVRSSNEQAAAIDEALAAEKLPAMGVLLAEARWSLLVQGLNRKMPRVMPREAVRMLPAMDDRLREKIETIKDNRVLADPLPRAKTVKGYEALLHEVQSVGRRLETIGRVAEFMRQCSATVSKRLKAQLDPEDRKVLDTNYGKWAVTVAGMLADLQEREIELRMQRLDLAIESLQQPAMSKEKLLSAYTFATDAAIVAAFLNGDSPGVTRRRGKTSKTITSRKNVNEDSAPAKKYLRETLNEPRLAHRVREKTKRARELAGDLTAKAQLLFEGINWWVRGRYGAGPNMFGLAKSPQAVVSPAAQMGLFMPAQLPNPTNPQQIRPGQQASPQYDRRHHYWWAFDDRRIRRRAFRGDDTRYSWQDQPRTTTETYWCSNTRTTVTSTVRAGDAVDSYYRMYDARVRSVKSENVRRLVGFFEYTRALALLDPLVNGSSTEELQIYDEIVQEREELAVYTNLSRLVERGRTTLAEGGRAGEDFRRHSLAWMAALARVELGAMAAGFTNQAQPFAMVPPTQFELLAYQELLLDGFRTHYAALKNDPAVQFYWSFKNAVVTLADRQQGRQNINEPRAIAYARRAAVTRLFGQAVASLGARQLGRPQLAELIAKIDEISELETIIARKVLGLGQTVQAGSKNYNVRQQLGSRREVENTRTGRIQVRETGAVQPSRSPINK